MKHKKAILVITENYEEEQYIMFKFPEAWWDDRSGQVVFSMPLEKEEQVKEAIREYNEHKELKKK